MLADLHMHSNYSDGNLSPEDLVQHAVECNLSAIAITDHDVVASYAVALEYINKNLLPITIIPAVEFNTSEINREVHILGYNINVSSENLAVAMSNLQEARTIRIQKIIEKLQNIGYKICMKEVLQQSFSALSLGRPHVASVLVQKGFFLKNSLAFDTLLSKGKPAYVPHVKISVSEAIDLIKVADGIPVLAHPGLIKDDTYVDFLFNNYPIEGIEAFYPKHSPIQVYNYLNLARKRNLLVSGGSDFHATKGRYPDKLGVFSLNYHQIYDIMSHCNKRL